MGSVLLIFAYNMNTPVTDGDPKDRKQENAICYGLTFTAVSLMFGGSSNGGYFNPAVVLGVLI